MSLCSSPLLTFILRNRHTGKLYRALYITTMDRLMVSQSKRSTKTMKPNMGVDTIPRPRLKAIRKIVVSVNTRLIVTRPASNSLKRNCISFAFGRDLEASLAILTRHGNWPGTTEITRKTRMGRPRLPSRACTISRTPTLADMETVGPPPLRFQPYLLTMVLGMGLQVRFGRSNNPRATTTASRRRCFRGSASTNDYLIGLSFGLSLNSTPHSTVQRAETRLMRLRSASG